MSTRWTPSPLSNSFFSEFNREYLHGALVSAVQAKTGYKIDRQSDDDLQALMRRVYINLAADPFTNVREQVGKMNAAVVSEALPTISSAVLQHLVYARDLGKLPDPISYPKNTSTYGNKIPDNTKFAL
jgi:hypothetical protein